MTMSADNLNPVEIADVNSEGQPLDFEYLGDNDWQSEGNNDDDERRELGHSPAASESKEPVDDARTIGPLTTQAVKTGRALETPPVKGGPALVPRMMAALSGLRGRVRRALSPTEGDSTRSSSVTLGGMDVGSPTIDTPVQEKIKKTAGNRERASSRSTSHAHRKGGSRGRRERGASVSITATGQRRISLRRGSEWNDSHSFDGSPRKGKESASQHDDDEFLHRIRPGSEGQVGGQAGMNDGLDGRDGSQAELRRQNAQLIERNDRLAREVADMKALLEQLTTQLQTQSHAQDENKSDDGPPPGEEADGRANRRRRRRSVAGLDLAGFAAAGTQQPGTILATRKPTAHPTLTSLAAPAVRHFHRKWVEYQAATAQNPHERRRLCIMMRGVCDMLLAGGRRPPEAEDLWNPRWTLPAHISDEYLVALMTARLDEPLDPAERAAEANQLERALCKAQADYGRLYPYDRVMNIASTIRGLEKKHLGTDPVTGAGNVHPNEKRMLQLITLCMRPFYKALAVWGQLKAKTLVLGGATRQERRSELLQLFVDSGENMRKADGNTLAWRGERDGEGKAMTKDDHKNEWRQHPMLKEIFGAEEAAKLRRASPPAPKKLRRIGGACWVCGRKGHKATECRHATDEEKARSNSDWWKLRQAAKDRGETWKPRLGGNAPKLKRTTTTDAAETTAAEQESTPDADVDLE
jgi:hypothetical protein